MKCFIITNKQLITAICAICAICVASLAVLGSIGILADSDRLLPIYCVVTEKKQIAISFNAAWDNAKKVQNNNYHV